MQITCRNHPKAVRHIYTIMKLELAASFLVPWVLSRSCTFSITQCFVPLVMRQQQLCRDQQFSEKGYQVFWKPPSARAQKKASTRIRVLCCVVLALLLLFTPTEHFSWIVIHRGGHHALVVCGESCHSLVQFPNPNDSWELFSIGFEYC